MTREARDSLVYTAINLFGSFIPIVAAAIAVAASPGSTFSIYSFSSRGEVVIVCSSLLVGVFYTLYFFKDRPGLSGLSGSIFWVTLVFLLVGIVIYTTYLGLHATPKSSSKVLFVVSIIFVAWSAFALYGSQLIQGRFTSLPKARAKQQDRLEDRFDGRRKK